MAAPAATPSDVIERINRALDRTLKSQALETQFTSSCLAVKQSSPDEFGQLIDTEIDKWRQIFVAAGLTPR